MVFRGRAKHPPFLELFYTTCAVWGVLSTSQVRATEGKVKRVVVFDAKNARAEIIRRRLVHLDVPLPLLLDPLEPLLVVDALLLAHALEHLEDARHHPLEAAEVHVRAAVEELEHLVLVLLDLVLDVHLAALAVLRLARERVVDAELTGEPLDALRELVVVQLRVRVGDAHEEPRQTLELPVLDVLDEKAANVR